jgi:hypothetical protein
MNAVDKATATQLQNIQTRTGKTLEQLNALIKKSGLAKQGQIRDLLKQELGLSHGNANTLAYFYLNPVRQPNADAPRVPADAVLDDIYTGPKAELRPIHDKVMAAINKWGEFELAPRRAMSACGAKSNLPCSARPAKCVWKWA